MSTDEQAVVEVSRDGTTGVVAISRPDKFNCLSTAVWAGLGAALDEFECNEAVRAVLITAQGQNFCTGADLEEVLTARGRRDDLSRLLANGSALLERLERTPLPVVAAVQGLALAGGLELTLACDVVFAAQGARFGDQHARFGLVPGWGGSQRLTRLVGLRRAMDLFYSARWLEAKDAQAIGLVNFVVEEQALREEALAYCNELGHRSRSGLATMKRLAREGLDKPLADGIAFEHDIAVDALMGADAAEGLAAFAARRDPEFP